MDAKTDDKSAGKCPVMHTAKTNRDWWPKQLNLDVLHRNSSLPDPMGESFDYAKEFKSLSIRRVDIQNDAHNDRPVPHLANRLLLRQSGSPFSGLALGKSEHAFCRT